MSCSPSKKRTVDLSTKLSIMSQVSEQGASPCSLSRSLNLHRKAVTNIMCRARKGHTFHNREGRPSAFDDESLNVIHFKNASSTALTEQVKIGILKQEFANTMVRRGSNDESKGISRRTLNRYLKLLFK